jgi:hypothetical protein
MRHHMLALWLGMAVLCMRMLMPAGFMPVVDAGGVSLRVCSGMAVQPAPMAMHASAGHHDDAPEHESRPDQPCGFAGLSMPALGAADLVPVVPAQTGDPVGDAGGLIVAVPREPAHLRPPPIGPPATT